MVGEPLKKKKEGRKAGRQAATKDVFCIAADLRWVGESGSLLRKCSGCEGAKRTEDVG